MSSFSAIGANGYSALQNAQQGINRGMAKFERDEQVVAQGSTTSQSGGNDSVTGALVNAQQHALDVEASARALSIADQTLGTLLDVKA